MYKKISFILLFCLSVVVGVSAKVYKVDDVPNVHLRDKTQYVTDPDGFLSPSARAEANAVLGALSDSTTVEVAMVILGDIGNADAYDFALELGRTWGVGKKDKNSGVVVLFAMKQRQVRIQTGSGAEGVLPDVSAKRLIDNEVLPLMRKDDLDGAVVGLSRGLYKVFTDPAAAAELRSEQANNAKSELADVFTALGVLIGFIAYALLLYYIFKMRGNTSHQKAVYYRNRRAIFIFFAILSLGSGIPAAVAIYLLAYYYRNKRRKCEICNTVMVKLSEKDDNAYLSAAQDMEEKLDSVDYDVWLCPKCGAKEIFPFVKNSAKYTQCPRCKAHTMKLLYERVEKRATTRSEGVVVRVYECKNCGFRKEERLKTPKEPPVAPIVVGGVVGGMAAGRRGGGGGGFGGGSWGGGGFSGGGAGGSW